MSHLWIAFDFHALVPWPNSMCVLLRHAKLCVPHLQRTTNALFDDDVQRLPRHNFEHPAHHIETVAVVPISPRLALQRDLCQCVAPLLQIDELAALCFFGELFVNLVVGALGRRPWIIQGRAVADARGVSQQLSKSDGLLEGLVVLLTALRQHSHQLLGEGWDVLGKWVVEVNVPGRLLKVSHEGGCHETFRHGKETDDCVAIHLDVVLSICKACILVEYEAAIPHNSAGQAGKVLHSGTPLQVLANPFQWLPLHAN
mmetsp:Transcript_45663/g.74172  ORF Transcript_45663/g.74172 Transcript_45663/m.74172 type:complete len:257 (+) Transcript_45663:1384-2154(+)